MEIPRAQRGLPGEFESANLRLENPSMETGRTAAEMASGGGEHEKLAYSNRVPTEMRDLTVFKRRRGAYAGVHTAIITLYSSLRVRGTRQKDLRFARS